jgi:hypothetical protein
MAAKKFQGFCENSRRDMAVLAYEQDGEIKIDLVEYHWSVLVDGKPLPFVAMEDGSQVLASEVEGYLGVDLEPENDTAERELEAKWADVVRQLEISVPVRDDDEDSDDDEDEDEDSEDEPVRVRPRRR